jgi:hypothetical protein
MKALKVSCAMAILAGVLCASGVRAQSYGDQDQVLTIGAAEFRAWSSPDPYIDSDGYLYNNGDYLYRAPLSLPEGAVVENLCLYANDSDPGDFKFIDAYLVAVKLVPGGEGPAVNSVAQGTYSSSNVGYGYYCSEPFSYALRGRIDIDEDEILDAVAYYVWADVPQATQNSLGLGGVQITWRRAVSDPPPAPTFGDVPASDPGFLFIEALVSSGITAGCAGGNYCPDANLTRRQMAVFLAKALGLHWTDTTP